MKIHEYQGKEILKKYGVPVPRAIPAFSVDEAVEAAKALGGSVWVVKAQIHAGGRGKGGGVKVAKSLDEVKLYATQILGMQLVTHQTGPEGQKVRRLLIEEGADIKKEYYLGMVVDRASQKVCVMASSEGGMDIEEVAEHTPELIHKVYVDPATGLTDAEADDLSGKIGMPAECVAGARVALQGLYKAFVETDADLAEINPLVTTGDNHVVALDSKMNFDSNALFRHPEILEMRDLDEEDPAEIEASKYDLAYISLDGNIGCLVNGAGLAMATMDSIKLYGGEPANFLDVGGGATTEKVTEAFKIMLKNPALKAILVNIFGGIMKCDVIAEGVIAAAKQVKLQVPLVVRMKGTNEDLGKKMLAESGLPIISADTMAQAAERVVAAADGKPIPTGDGLSGVAALAGVAGIAGAGAAVASTKSKGDFAGAVGDMVSGVSDTASSTVHAVAGGAKHVATGAYDVVVDGAEAVFSGVGHVAESVGEVVGGVADTAVATAGAVGAGAAAMVGLKHDKNKTSEDSTCKTGGRCRRFGWLFLILALILALLLLKYCSKKEETPAPVAPAVVTPAVVTPAPAAPEAKASLGTWALNLVDGKYELNGQVADQATKDAMLAAAKKVYGDANVVDKLTVDPKAPAVGFKGDWQALFNLFKGNGAHLNSTADGVTIAGEVDDATKASLMDKIKALLPNFNLVDHLMKKGAIASEGAALLKVEFASSSSAIPASAKTGLLAFAADLKKTGQKGEISGHSDNLGNAKVNLTLSEARAKAVMAFLVMHGVPAKDLTAKGVGDAAPIADNSTADGRARNRRVEFSPAK